MKTSIFFSRIFLCLSFIIFSIQINHAQYVARHNLTSQQYQNEYNKWKSKHYELWQVSGYGVNNKARFAAIWIKKSGPAVKGYHNMNNSQYQSRVNNMASNGYYIKRVSAYTLNNKDYYAAVFEKNNGKKWVARHRMGASKYQEEYNKWKRAGYRLVDVDGYQLNGKSRFAAVWVKKSGPALATHHNMTSEQYQAKSNYYVSRGYRTTHVSGYAVGGKDYYAAIWEKKGGKKWAARHRLSPTNYQNTVDNFHYQGYKLTRASGYLMNGKLRFAAIWEEGPFSYTSINKIDNVVKFFMNSYDIPGLQIAVTKNEKLVFAKGYGYADKENKTLMSPRTIGRIASISKPITSVAMMELKEKKPGFSFNRKVFGSNGILGSQYGSKAYSNHEKAIRVVNLLEHTAGGNTWDNNFKQEHNGKSENPETDDPMFNFNSYTFKKLIGWTLDNRNPDYTPGSYFAYSNFGYCVLGRVLEKMTGQTYAKWVKANVLKKCGIKDMHIGNNSKSEKRKNEMVYYGQGSDKPYNWNVKRMDSHGGWIASCIDLLRFAVRVDGRNGKKDIISQSSFNTMMKQESYNPNPLSDSNFAKGWEVTRNGGYVHGGSLPGTFSRLAIRADGYCYAIIINTKSKKSGFGSAFRKMLGEVIDIIKGDNNLPSYDLF